jgi:CRISPR-associated protein Csy2
VESIYSIGQWISPHRLACPEDLLWYVDNDLDAGLYRLNNDYAQRAHRA